MAEIIPNNAELESLLAEDKPIILLFTNGDDLRGEFSTAYKKAVEEHSDITFVKINPKQNPEAAARFNVGSKAVMIAYYKGEELTRRSRPWGVDIPLAIELLEAATPPAPAEEAPTPVDATDVANHKPQAEKTEKGNTIVDTKPVNVTDQNFQQEVIDYQLPVVVDFWAEWCGPCRMVAPVLEKLAEEYAGKIRIAKVDVDNNPGLAQAFQVMSIPTIMMFKERNIVFSQPGALPEAAFRDLFEQLIALEIPPQEETTEENPAQ